MNVFVFTAVRVHLHLKQRHLFVAQFFSVKKVAAPSQSPKSNRVRTPIRDRRDCLRNKACMEAESILVLYILSRLQIFLTEKQNLCLKPFFSCIQQQRGLFKLLKNYFNYKLNILLIRTCCCTKNKENGKCIHPECYAV